MNIVTKINEWRTIRKQLVDKTVGFIPTMGNLHAGHLSLCERSKMENEITVVSIFINPAQFNQSSDFDNYPRTLLQDQECLVDNNIDYLFLPDAHDIYADNYQMQVMETNLSLELEGEFRPGHFKGVLTIVLKLLNLIQPSRTYFGEKDYQQLLLIKKMVDCLFLPVQVVGCETVRAADGLALSSRNSRLTPEQRTTAIIFPQLLQSNFSTNEIAKQLEMLGFKIDYIVEKWRRRLGAVWLGNVRLIDNIVIK